MDSVLLVEITETAGDDHFSFGPQFKFIYRLSVSINFVWEFKGIAGMVLIMYYISLTAKKLPR